MYAFAVARKSACPETSYTDFFISVVSLSLCLCLCLSSPPDIWGVFFLFLLTYDCDDSINLQVTLNFPLFLLPIYF
ncbi:hypothetical protein F5X99DRAFT_389765 [Biscogniauxia marginata]|nr:hypothetical protein F5X99DRAFT_389765 [Biscogniauxia marginata]